MVKAKKTTSTTATIQSKNKVKAIAQHGKAPPGVKVPTEAEAASPEFVEQVPTRPAVDKEYTPDSELHTQKPMPTTPADLPPPVPEKDDLLKQLQTDVIDIMQARMKKMEDIIFEQQAYTKKQAARLDQLSTGQTEFLTQLRDTLGSKSEQLSQLSNSVSDVQSRVLAIEQPVVDITKLPWY